MKNNIQESYCSLEVSKLLKEIGFNCECNSHYSLALTTQTHETDGTSGPFAWEKGELSVVNDYNTNKSLGKYYNDIDWYGCSRPTHQTAIKWLRVNFGYDVEARGIRYAGDTRSSGYQPYVNGVVVDMKKFDDYDEAIEYGLIETLKEYGLLETLKNP